MGKFKFAVNGRALAMDEAEGSVKILADARTDKILGVHVLGPQGSSLVAEAAMVMEFGGSAEDMCADVSCASDAAGGDEGGGVGGGEAGDSFVED